MKEAQKASIRIGESKRHTWSQWKIEWNLSETWHLIDAWCQSHAVPLHNKHAHQRRTTASIGTSSVNSGTGFCCSTGVKELLTYVATASVQGYGKLSWVKRLQLKKHGRSSQHLIQTSYKKEPSTSKDECEEKPKKERGARQYRDKVRALAATKCPPRIR